MHRALHTEEQGIVRFSFSHFLSEEQVEEAVQAIKEMTAGEEI
jgi:cysteine sulfinate desulfinase/cysteine desulfurase-like protein